MFSAKSMTPIDRQLSKLVVKIIHGLLMMQQSAAFRKPVPHKALGLQDYKLIVKKPTDLNLIRRQNNEGKYKFVEQILDEIQLCWDNCKLYNAIGSEIYQQALFLQNAFDKLGLQILPQLWKDINREEYNQKFNERKIEDQKLKKPDNKQTKKSIPIQQEYPSQQIGRPKTKRSGGPRYQQEEELPSYSVEQKKQKNQVQMDYQEIDMNQQGGYSQPNLDKESMDIQGGDQGPQIVVQPIYVNLSQYPTREQLLELSNHLKTLYNNEDYGQIEKVLEILHNNQKQNMALNKNGLMTFKMNKIHHSTYLRIVRVLSLEQQQNILIQ